jgi:hypothetical protein
MILAPTIGDTCHDPYAPLWFEREVTTLHPVRVRALSNTDRADAFAAKCEEALDYLMKHPTTHYALAAAMDWNPAATWRVLQRLQEQSLIERYLDGGSYGFVYRGVA